MSSFTSRNLFRPAGRDLSYHRAHRVGETRPKTSASAEPTGCRGTSAMSRRVSGRLALSCAEVSCDLRKLHIRRTINPDLSLAVRVPLLDAQGPVAERRRRWAPHGGRACE